MGIVKSPKRFGKRRYKKASNALIRALSKQLNVKIKPHPNNILKKPIPHMSEKTEKKGLEETYFYFFDNGDLNVKNIIAYFNDTLEMDSFTITIEGLPKTKLVEFLTEKGLVRMSKHENLNNKVNKQSVFSEFSYDDSFDYYTSKGHEMILNISNSKKKAYDILCTFVKENEVALEVKKYLEAYCRKFDNRIQIITKNSHGYHIEAIDVKKVEVDFDKYYNDDFNYKELEENILSEDNGIILLPGVPGSGKSSLIKYMIRNIDREFCYLPANNIDIFSDPSSIPFIIQELNNKVLVIEDCEKLLKSRSEGNNTSEVATILNISDGILGDYLNLKMILTLNTTENIDTALLRKGRLIYTYDFQKLTVDKTNALATHLNIEEKFAEEKPLTDLLNYHKDNGGDKIQKKKTSIGFKK